MGATDDQIEDAVQYADAVVLRGLLYQLTGDEEVAKTKVTRAQAGMGRGVIVASEADVALLRRKAAELPQGLSRLGRGPDRDRSDGPAAGHHEPCRRRAR